MQIPAEMAAILLALGTAVIAVVGKWLLSKVTKISEKIQSPIVEQLYKELGEKYIPKAVAYVDQTFVDQLKKYSDWEPDKETYEKNRSEALQKAVDSIMGIIPKFFAKKLKQCFNDVPSTLKTLIEDYIKAQKQPKTKSVERIEEKKIIEE